jgi:hypothetical protein
VPVVDAGAVRVPTFRTTSATRSEAPCCENESALSTRFGRTPAAADQRTEAYTDRGAAEHAGVAGLALPGGDGLIA